MSESQAADTDDLPQHVYRWLESVQRRIAAELDELTSGQTRAVGFRRLRVLQLIDDDGIRQQELADRASVTKQAVGDFVDALETDGLVERTPDPSDGRAWLILRTKSGKQMNDELNSAINEVEVKLARDVGADRYQVFLDVLRELGHGAT